MKELCIILFSTYTVHGCSICRLQGSCRFTHGTRSKDKYYVVLTKDSVAYLLKCMSWFNIIHKYVRSPYSMDFFFHLKWYSVVCQSLSKHLNSLFSRRNIFFFKNVFKKLLFMQQCGYEWVKKMFLGLYHNIMIC